jgi:hypothetical protein
LLMRHIQSGDKVVFPPCTDRSDIHLKLI